MSDTKKYPIDSFLDEIRAAVARNDRGKLAALKRGFSETTEHYAWPHIAPHCDITDPRQRAIWLTIAGAAALLEPKGFMRSNVGNMGATMREIALGSKQSKKPEDVLNSFEARFRRLLTCQTTEELCKHLIRAIRAAEAKEKPVDVVKLFWDLQDWENRAKRDVRVEWAQGYWAA
jgi:CRISPR type I-E-associated protein CasB/Cse2